MCVFIIIITAGVDRPNIMPAEDAFIPTDNISNVTFVCSSEADNIYWQLNGRQLQNEDEIQLYANRSIFITDSIDNNTYSTSLMVALEGRRVLAMVADPIEVKCQAFNRSDFSSNSTKTYNIFQYGKKDDNTT